MSLAEILESEIQGEISAIQQQANTRAAEIVSQAQEQAQALIDSRTRLLANEKAAGLTRARSAADLDSNAQRLSASDSLQTRAFQEAEGQLKVIPQHPEYSHIVQRLLQEAHAALPTAEAIETSSGELETVRQVAQSLGIQAPVRVNESVTTGVRLVGAGGKTSLQNTLLGRLQSGRETLSAQVSRLLQE
ncbi:V-type ATP synthase subunit E [Deinococcus sp. KNUC1210]|uniref:V-type ATP synthase subunit E n=1 Tax=Deinococcus sp. KNUC1210 TaxID=2917691 RepID=UPI001EEFE45D|nr:V-type ATP synthase subunit E [Deinococcus sp. KNUC1210]ULH15259.1 V-type ATP synthase subunit E [Deinococcus sp. KNUC1210]